MGRQQISGNLRITKRLFERLSFDKALSELRKNNDDFTEFHCKVLWSPYQTTRLYPTGRIEPVYRDKCKSRDFEKDCFGRIL
jgi:hypothetical protein